LLVEISFGSQGGIPCDPFAKNDVGRTPGS
jgi:hypothetical protein